MISQCSAPRNEFLKIFMINLAYLKITTKCTQVDNEPSSELKIDIILFSFYQYLEIVIFISVKQRLYILISKKVFELIHNFFSQNIPYIYITHIVY